MANDVEIIVEASVADALVKLDLVKHAVKDVGDAGGVTSRQIGDETNRGSLVSSMGRLEQHLLHFNGSGPMGLGVLETGLARMGGRVLTVTNGFDRGAQAVGQWISGLADGVPILGSLADTTGAFVSGLGSLVAVLGPVASATGVAVAAFLVLDTVLNALATTVGTVIAIFADLVAPVTLVTALLGGLAAAFVIAAKSAFGQGGALGGQVEILKHQFDNLTKTLVNDFMPVFRFLIDNAHSALTYLNQIAKLPLADAFRSLATTGVQAVSKFLGQVGSLLARPFRLAVQIAFGSGKGGNEVASAVAGLWKQFTDFLFGYTKTHPVQIAPHTFVLRKETVDGALQPFLDWFNRHNFTAQGERIGRQILRGLAPLAKPLGQFIVNVLEDAAIQSAHDFVSILHIRLWPVISREAGAAGHAIERVLRSAASTAAQFIVSVLSRAWNAVKTAAAGAWHYISSLVGGILQSIAASIEHKISSAWNAVKTAAQNVWNFIKGLFDQVLSINISWPSPPGWVNSILGAGGSILGGAASVAGAVTNAAGHLPSVVSGGGSQGASVVVVNHFHSVDLTTAAQRRRVAATMGDEVVRRFQQQAGG